MYKQRITFLKKREPICFYALNILLKSSRCPFIKIEVSLDNLKILSLQSQFWSILKRARTFYSDNVHTFKDRLIVVLQHHWSAAFILCDLCCFVFFWDKSGFIGTLQNRESIFGSMESKHRYNVEFLSWNHLLKNAIESFRFLFKDTARLLSWAGEKKRWVTSKSLMLTWGRSGVSRILWISLVHSALSTSVSAENCEFKANFEEILPLARFHLIGALRSVEDEAKSLLPEQDIFIIVIFVL